MAKNIKYVNFKDNETGRTYTLRLTYKTKKVLGVPEVKILIMEGHDKPTTFWGKLVESWKYYEGEDVWDPFYTDFSLEDYCKWICANKSDFYATIEKVKTEWGQI